MPWYLTFATLEIMRKLQDILVYVQRRALTLIDAFGCDVNDAK